ncbi:hypothetical protein BJ508DRAFT_307559 [Ascobolus immersus RN42]|uniref:BTB domain-containing protein n=1 Tax=Ascobolus immersus RN42 TaxID=1160509 RepID=A0A3N4I4F8_ASCIM|nr:hypothetical protein BJ508DRAFT_307559 [Ascobolus immersus RN42]
MPTSIIYQCSKCTALHREKHTVHVGCMIGGPAESVFRIPRTIDDGSYVEDMKEKQAYELYKLEQTVISTRAEKQANILQALTLPDNQSTITVVLVHKSSEEEVEKYVLHKGLLIATSEYFRALFNFDGKETQDSMVTLGEPTDHPIPFSCYVQFVYTGDYIHKPHHKNGLAMVHVMVYLLADRLIADSLKELALEKLKGVLVSPKNRPAGMILLGLIDLVYRSTERFIQGSGAMSVDGEASDASAAPQQENELAEFGIHLPASEENEIQNHPLRNLVAHYAASKLTELGKCSQWGVLLDAYPEFSEDVLDWAISREYDPEEE